MEDGEDTYIVSPCEFHQINHKIEWGEPNGEVHTLFFENTNKNHIENRKIKIQQKKEEAFETIANRVTEKTILAKKELLAKMYLELYHHHNTDPQTKLDVLKELTKLSFTTIV